MKIFGAGVDVTVTIPLVDSGGNAYGIDGSVSYRVLDQLDVEIKPSSVLGTYVDGDIEVSITVWAALNALQGDNLREARSIELSFSDGTNNVILKDFYVIEASQVLLVGVNSFQTYSEAMVSGLECVGIDAWDVADETQRIAALLDAKMHIAQLSFTNIFQRYDQANIGDFGFFVAGNLDFMTPTIFGSFPDIFKKKLKLAQIVEANAILGDDPIGDQRRAGLTSSRIGETAETYRDGKPLILPVCARALSYLSGYITFNRRLGRS